MSASGNKSLPRIDISRGVMVRARLFSSFIDDLHPYSKDSQSGTDKYFTNADVNERNCLEALENRGVSCVLRSFRVTPLTLTFYCTWQFKTYKCFIFPTGGTNIKTIIASIDHDLDDMYVWAKDLQLSDLFPLGLHRVRIIKLPRANLPLRNQMVLIYSADPVSSPPNNTLAKLYDVHWAGNVVVLKCSRRDPKQIIQMGWGDKQLVDVIVALYVWTLHMHLKESIIWHYLSCIILNDFNRTNKVAEEGSFHASPQVQIDVLVMRK